MNGRSEKPFSTHAGNAPYLLAEKPIPDKGGALRTTALQSALQNDVPRNWRQTPRRVAPHPRPPLAGLEVPGDRVVLQTHKKHLGLHVI